MLDEIDDVLVTLCRGCDVAFAVQEGWEGYCASCCALSDDHAAGKHYRHVVLACVECQLGSDALLRDIA